MSGHWQIWAGGRFWRLLLVTGLVAWTVLAASLDNGHLGVFHDDGLYLTSARSLRDGKGFGLPSRPGEPPPKYPIGLPATIAVALKLDPGPKTLDREIVVGRGVVILGGWVFFLAAYSWLRRVGVSPGLACLIVLATAYHQSVLIGGAITIFADLPFAGVVFVLMSRWVGSRRKSETRPIRHAFVNGLLAGYGFLLRSNGVSLVFAALLAAAIGPRWRTGVWSCLAGLTIAVVPASYYAGLHPRVVPSNSYLLEMKSGWSSVESGLHILAANTEATALDFPARVVATPATFIAPISAVLASHPIGSWAFRIAIAAIVMLGLVVLGRSSRRVDIPAWSNALSTVAIFLVWPWTSIMDRFLMSLIPLVLVSFARGLDVLGSSLGLVDGAREKLVMMILSCLLLGNVAVVGRSAYLFHHNGRQWAGASHRASLDSALQMIRDRTESNSVVAATWPEMVYLQTGRTVVPLVEDDSILTGKLGDVGRLQLWRAETIGRPFYALVRSREEDQGPPRIDLPQIEALSKVPGLEVREVQRTADGRYGIYQVLDRTPAEATLSK